MDIAREQTKFTNICRLECTNSRTHLCSILVHVQDDILMGTWRHRCIGALFLFKPLGTLWLGQVAWLSLKISYTKLGPVTQILWGLKAHSRVSLMSFQMFERDSRHRNRGTTQRPDRRHGHFWRFQSSRFPMICSLQPLIFWPWQGFPVDWGFSPFGACPSWPNSYLAAPWSLWRGWLPPSCQSCTMKWRRAMAMPNLPHTLRWNLMEPWWNIQCQFAFWVVLLIFVFFPLAHGLMIPLASIFQRVETTKQFSKRCLCCCR